MDPSECPVVLLVSSLPASVRAITAGCPAVVSDTTARQRAARCGAPVLEQGLAPKYVAEPC